MRLDDHSDFNMTTYQDEFDLYFARAKLDEEMAREQQEVSAVGDAANRRGSLPGEMVVQLEVPTHHRRALSCKLPARKKSKKGSSKSPRESTPVIDPHPRTEQHGGNREQLGSVSPRKLSVDRLSVTATGGGCGRGDEDEEDEEVQQQGISMNYITETTLRAPSPRMMGKCQSAPHSRSSSWKNQRRPSRSLKQKTSNTTTDYSQYNNGNNGEDSPGGGSSGHGSVTHFEEEVTKKLEQLKLLQAEDVCVVRNFSTSSRGLINRGDSFKRKPRSSTASITSDGGGSGGAGGGVVSPGGGVGCGRGRHLSVGSQGSSAETPPPIQKVLVVGDRRVGKTALLQQFMTSTYMGAVETSFDDDCEKTVTVLLDGEETMIDFIDVPVESDLSQYGAVDGYLMCFSITNKPSFHYMKDVLESVVKTNAASPPALIVVANKSDLVRKRAVSENEARLLCIKNGCKYIEVSAVINHKVDDLLVGITTQVRLNPRRHESRRNAKDAQKNVSCVSAKGLMQLIFKRNHQTSKSCDNLLVL